jgi:hypothetical protein
VAKCRATFLVSVRTVPWPRCERGTVPPLAEKIKLMLMTERVRTHSTRMSSRPDTSTALTHAASDSGLLVTSCLQ